MFFYTELRNELALHDSQPSCRLDSLEFESLQCIGDKEECTIVTEMSISIKIYLIVNDIIHNTRSS